MTIPTDDQIPGQMNLTETEMPADDPAAPTVSEAGWKAQALPADATAADIVTHSLLREMITHLETIAEHLGASIAREIIK